MNLHFALTKTRTLQGARPSGGHGACFARRMHAAIPPIPARRGRIERLTGWGKAFTVRRRILPVMRLAPLPAALAILLLSPALARAQAAPAVTAGPRSRAVAIPIEIVSPVGGAGCFYRGRVVEGVVVTVASLAAGGTMLWGVTHDDRDVTIINAVAYGVARAAGIYLAAEPVAPPAPAPAPTPLPPPPTGKAVGLFPRFSF
jgi:hypothetical protein